MVGRPFTQYIAANPIAAEHVTIADPDNYFTATRAETALEELKDEIDALVVSGGGISVASEAEVIAGTNNTKAVTPLRATVIAEKYDARRSGLDTAGTAAANSTALQNAINTAGAVPGGVLRIPEGAYTFNAGVTQPFDRLEFVGDGNGVTRLLYSGTGGTALTVTAENLCKFRQFALENTGTGAVGIKVQGGANGSTFPAWMHELDDILVLSFTGYGVHAGNCEQLKAHRVWSYGNGTGFRVDNALGTIPSMGNTFVLCRAHANTTHGFYLDAQIAPRFITCQALNNGTSGAGPQFYSNYSYGAIVDQIDVENTAATGGNGITFAGVNAHISCNAYGLATGITMTFSDGCYIGPSRFATVTTPITSGASNTALTIYDGGNLGTITNASAAEELHFVGRRTSSRTLAVSGLAGRGYIEFETEQSADPAAPAANGARLFTKDNGAGKTQLIARFNTGANVVVATQP